VARERRARILYWWLEDHEGWDDSLEGLLLSFTHHLSETGEIMSSFSEGSLSSDLRHFVNNGVCEHILHHSGPRYQLHAKEKWPQEFLRDFASQLGQSAPAS